MCDGRSPGTKPKVASLPADPLGYDTRDLRKCALTMAADALSGRNAAAVKAEVDRVRRRFAAHGLRPGTREDGTVKPDVALAVVRNGTGDVLMLKRKVAEGSLVWAFPGGKLETGEDSAGAASREAGEETGVACRPVRLLGVRVHPVTGKAIAYWLCDHVSGVPTLREPEKADAVAWLSPETVRALVGDTLYGPVAEAILGGNAPAPESP